MIRPLTSGDGALLRQGLRALSDRTRQLRWRVALVDIGRALGWVPQLAGGDPDFAVGACAADGGPIGVARWALDDDEAEVAVTVIDTWHGRGVGTRLLDAVIVQARAHDILALRACVALDNQPAMRRVGGRRVAYHCGGTLEYEIPVSAQDAKEADVGK